MGNSLKATHVYFLSKAMLFIMALTATLFAAARKTAAQPEQSMQASQPGSP